MDLKTWVLHWVLEFLGAYTDPFSPASAKCVEVRVTKAEHVVSCTYKKPDGPSLRILISWEKENRPKE